MKSIKNSLVMSIVLTVALCTSVQTIAMVKEENKFLSTAQKEQLRDALVSKDEFLGSRKRNPAMVKKVEEQKKAIEKILYGRELYDKDDIFVAIYL
jgi:hypothetical protein